MGDPESARKTEREASKRPMWLCEAIVGGGWSRRPCWVGWQRVALVRRRAGQQAGSWRCGHAGQGPSGGASTGGAEREVGAGATSTGSAAMGSHGVAAAFGVARGGARRLPAVVHV